MKRKIFQFNDNDLQTSLTLYRENNAYVVLEINHKTCKNKAKGFICIKDAVQYYKQRLKEILTIWG